MVKVLLILGLLVAAYLVIRGKPSATRLALTRIATCSVLAVGIVAILMPSGVTSVANALGVGRGADLVLYVLTIAFLLSAAGLHKKLHELEDRYVDLVRHLAIVTASRDARLAVPDSDTHCQRTDPILPEQ